ncbi:DUF4815 domain-containing protein, partial [Arthrospira platensis SPKY1]|nr:DUF4815 domain-containing protein [Arthrospira platensis SPKY1]
MTRVRTDLAPYFDDYKDEKKFYRILFRPGYPVQARELTQLQTILQKQIERFGDHVFQNGAQIIPGSSEGIKYASNISFVKIPATDAAYSANEAQLNEYWLNKKIRKKNDPENTILAKVIAVQTADASGNSSS